MARYIDADLLINDLKNPNLCNVTDKIFSVIDEQPTADVQPVKRGYWSQKYKEVETTSMNVMDDGIVYIPWGYKCSVCNNEKGKSENLCLYCGAKMGGETNDT